jgi:hypothetical protein
MSDKENNSEVPEIKKHIRVVQQKIDTYLADTQSPEVLIIKSHLICEYYLNQILLVKEVCDSNEMRKFTFFDKTQKAFDLNNSFEKYIYRKVKALNDIRNKTGHELEYILTESDVDTLGYINGKEYVLKKYDFDNIEKTLHFILVDTVLDVSLCLFRLITREKKALEKGQGESKVNSK